MTRSEVQKLSDELLLLKVAWLLGWKSIDKRYALFAHRGLSGRKPNDVDGIEHPVPDYPHDLNACHEMEKTIIKKGLVQDYVDHMFEENGEWHATARQRCEAFVLTMQK
ncbi:MAG: hypothetical protein E6R03_00410 [Hyphomicrobiaceae bacterium]|nr:MAG: hypothetical protein E6R03_00410 [Hyphomicrobiaceae bacterium]